jgi:hypothetical protein
MPTIQVKFKGGEIEAEGFGFVGTACGAMDFLRSAFDLKDETHKESYYAEVSGEESIENY